jgi:hypothetical protein
VDLGDRGQPFACEQVVKHRPGEARLALVQVGTIVGVRDTAAGAEGLQHRVHRPHAGDQQLADRRDVVQAGLVEQRLVVARGQRVAPLRAVPRAGVELEDAAGGLLFQPLAYIALAQPKRPGQLLRCGRAPLGQRRVQPEPVADVHAKHVHGANRGHEQVLDQRIAALVGGWRGRSRGGHAELLSVETDGAYHPHGRRRTASSAAPPGSPRRRRSSTRTTRATGTAAWTAKGSSDCAV